MLDEAYVERKAAERGKSYRRQVWETVFVALGCCLAFSALHVLGWF